MIYIYIYIYNILMIIYPLKIYEHQYIIILYKDINILFPIKNRILISLYSIRLVYIDLI